MNVIALSGREIQMYIMYIKVDSLRFRYRSYYLVIIKHSVLSQDFKCFICPWESRSKHIQGLANVKLGVGISSVLNSSCVCRFFCCFFHGFEKRN